MPQAPYALLRASINGAAVQSGGITVPASATVQLSASPSASVGANQYKYEIYGYPLGFAQPSGWSTDSKGVYFFSGSNPTPPIFTLPTVSNWGKFMLRLTLNNAISINPAVIPPSQLIDESTALSMLSVNGLADVGLYEANQFGTTWVPPVQASLRAIDTAVTAVAGANAKPPVSLVATGNISLTGEQTIDSVLTSASRVLLTAQTTTSQNGLWVTASGAWTRPTDFTSDSQVVVGQTVFVTSGTVYSHTNWQLTSGTTIAGAKTYAQLVSSTTSVGVIGPVDAIATSNISLSGTSAIDGVTLTSGVSRVLAEGQTTTSQNGPWLVQSGSWTRPSDFNVDSQVIQGQTVYVRPGGVTGGDTTWYLKSGSTIAGAKIYAKKQNGNIAPVRAIQTQKLLTQYGDPWVYDNTAQTWTEPYVVGGLAGTPWPVFDNIIPQVGDRLEVFGTGTPDSSAISNGVYVVTGLGSGSTKAVITRAPDLSTSIAFSTPIAYEVFDGVRYKGARRQLLTQGTITLGSTALQFSTVALPAVLEIDLSQPPYNIRDYPANSYDTATDHGRALDLFCYTYRTPGGQHVRGRLPSAHGGVIYIKEPFQHYGNVSIVGAGDQSSILAFPDAGGHCCTAQILGGSLAVDGFPGIGGTAVDSAAGATPLSTYRNGAGATDQRFYYNLSHAGLMLDDWTQFECRALIRFETLGSVLPLSHIVSCRGRRTIADVNDYGPTAFEGCPFSIKVNESSYPNVTLTASMRLTDTTAGVYGATVHVGGGAGTITGDGSIKPTEDAPNFTVRIETGGTAGVAGVKVSWAVDGLRFCAPIAMGTATALVISNEVNEFEQPFTAKVNLSGALVAGDTYKIPCSGVNQNVSLTSTTFVDTSHNYDVCLQYRSGKVYFFVSPVGGSLDSGSSAATGVSATGVVRQRYWENTMLGRPHNSGVFEASSDFNSFQGWIGSIRFKSSNVTAPGSVVSTLYDTGLQTAAVTGNQLCWVPNTTDVRLDAGGVYRARYRATRQPNAGYSWILPRSAVTGLQFGDGGFEGLTFGLGTAASQRACGLLTVSWRNHVFKDIGFQDGSRGWSSVGPDFGSINHNIRWSARWGFSLEYFQGALALTGYQNCAGGPQPCFFCISTTALNQSGGILFQNIDQSRKAMLLSEMQTSKLENWSCDGENQQQASTGRELARICVSDNCSITVDGNAFTCETMSAITQQGDATAGTGGRILIDNFSVVAIGATISNVAVNNWPPFSSLNANLPPFQIGNGVTYAGPTAFPVPIIDRVNKWQVRGVAGTVLLTTGTQAVAYQRGIVLKLATNTLGANSVYTIGTTGAAVGDTQDILVESQSTYTTTIANGGPAGAAGIYVNPATPAATKDRYRLRLDEKFNWVAT